MVTVSLIIAAANIVLAIYTAWYAYITRKTLRLAERQAEERTRPRVLVLLHQSRQNPGFAALRVENAGEELALDISLSVEPASYPSAVPGYATLGRLPVFNTVIPQLARGQILETFLLRIPHTNPTDPSSKVVFSANYLSIGGKPYKERYEYDLRVFAGLRPPKEPNAE